MPSSGRVLDPVERLSEVLFGLIMALTFTGTIHAASDGREEIRTVLIAAIGCNLAWGIVDAVMYLMADLVERGRELRCLQELRRAQTPEQGHAILAEALPDAIAKAMKPGDYESVRTWLLALPEQPRRLLTRRSYAGALGVFLLVTVSTFPVVVPFLFIDHPVTALRVSHAVALTMLFLIGHELGKYSGLRAWLTGTLMLGIGVLLALITMALGG